MKVVCHQIQIRKSFEFDFVVPPGIKVKKHLYKIRKNKQINFLNGNIDVNDVIK